MNDHPNHIISACCGSLREIADALQELAQALSLTGNECLAMKLTRVSSDLISDERAIHHAVGQWIAHDLARQNEGANLAIMGVLGGIKLANEAEKGART